ncbi:MULTISPECIES: FxDxF family PEP-CTERM protein [unclassified Phenylobacterium]|uniref:FxDxF family PEP-CTERM protein n=1 Tax=unclassified Phenylobacterium TaxID=2640670 RepID=UPI00083B9D39|nr:MULTISPECIES: FxDxF family PEP-CTERM protein [unclassified Phenylobacterium]
MSVHKHFFAGAAAALGLGAMAGGASAATFVEPWTTTPMGGISVAFGNDGLGIPGAESIPGETTSTHVYDEGTGAFTNTFSFELPDGIVGFTLSSIGFLANSSLTVSSFTFNGVDLAFTNTPTGDGGNTVLGADGPLPIVAGGPQVLTIAGFGGSEAVYAGTATFAAGVVPEPGAWALMILGFGGTGALLRRRRNALAFA